MTHSLKKFKYVERDGRKCVPNYFSVFGKVSINVIIYTTYNIHLKKIAWKNMKLYKHGVNFPLICLSLHSGWTQYSLQLYIFLFLMLSTWTTNSLKSNLAHNGIKWNKSLDCKCAQSRNFRQCDNDYGFIVTLTNHQCALGLALLMHVSINCLILEILISFDDIEENKFRVLFIYLMKYL